MDVSNSYQVIFEDGTPVYAGYQVYARNFTSEEDPRDPLTQEELDQVLKLARDVETATGKKILIWANEVQ